MEFIPNIYYINLQHRIARDEQFLGEMAKLDFSNTKVNRIEATYHSSFGIYGCCCSHIEALEIFLKTDDEYTIIFEDDFKLMVDKSVFNNIIKAIFESNVIFDVILLEGAIIESNSSSYSFLNRVTKSCGTAGYLITKKFAYKLLECFKECKKIFDSRSDWNPEIFYPEIRLDLHWHSLQKENLFYVTKPVIGCQRSGYSDIQKIFFESDQP